MTTQTFVGDSLHTYTRNTWAWNDVVAGADGKFYTSFIVDETHIAVKQWDAAQAQWTDYASFSATQSGDNGFQDHLDLVIDAQGHLHIAFKSYTGSGIPSDRGVKYGEFNGTSWTFSKVQSSSHPSGWMNYYDPKLALDADGYAHIVYLFANADTRDNYVRYATNASGTWAITDIDIGNGGINEQHEPWIGIGSDGTIQVTYVREDNQNDVSGNLYYRSKTGAGAWTAAEKLIDAVAAEKDYRYESSLDADGVLHVIVSDKMLDENWISISKTVSEYVKGSGQNVLFTTESDGSYVVTGYQEVGNIEYLLVQELDANAAALSSHIYTRQAGGVWLKGNAVDVDFGSELTMAVNLDGTAMVIALDWNLRNLTYDTGPATASSNPVIIPGSGLTAYVENATVPVDAGLTLTDPASATLASAQVAITGNFVASQDVLAFVNNNAVSFGNITASYNAASGVLTLISAGGTATVAQWQNALRVVTYTNSSENPSTSNRTVSITIDDGSNVSAAATKIISVARINDAPGFSGLDATPTYIEGSAAVVLDSNINLFDAELDLSNNWNGASVMLRRDGGANAQDIFEATGTLSLTGSGSGNVVVNGTTVGSYTMSGGQLVITFNSQAASALADAVVQQIAYRNTSDSPPASVNIAWTVNDGGTISSQGGQAETKTMVTAVTISAVNDEPTAQGMTQERFFTEDVSISLGAIVVTDVDTNETITATLTLSSAQAGTLATGTFGAATSTFNAGTGVWTITGSLADVNAALAAVIFTPAANWDQNLTVTTRIRDAAGTGPVDGTITLKAVPSMTHPWQRRRSAFR